jgi:hypothetical protein
LLHFKVKPFLQAAEGELIALSVAPNPELAAAVGLVSGVFPGRPPDSAPVVDFDHAKTHYVI